MTRQLNRKHLNDVLWYAVPLVVIALLALVTGPLFAQWFLPPESPSFLTVWGLGVLGNALIGGIFCFVISRNYLHLGEECMKRLIPVLLIISIIIYIIVILILTSGCSQVAAMPREIAAATQAIVNDTRTQSTDVYADIQRNIDMVAKLKTDLSTTKETDRQKLLARVIDELEQVTLSYEYLAMRKNDIRQQLMAKSAQIESLQNRVSGEIERLAKLRIDYAAQLSTVQDPNPEIVRTRRAAIQQAIGYVNMQIQLWQNFGNTQQAIKVETVNVQQKIDSFLSIIESSAILFRQGLNLLKLQRDINDALSLFSQDLPRIEQLSRDMAQSWQHLDLLVNALTNMNISIK